MTFYTDVNMYILLPMAAMFDSKCQPKNIIWPTALSSLQFNLGNSTDKYKVTNLHFLSFVLSLCLFDIQSGDDFDDNDVLSSNCNALFSSLKMTSEIK